MMPCKICGITSLNDATLSVKMGAAAIGFIFYKNSSRYIKPEIAKEIIINLKGKVAFVGVFVNEKIEEIHKIAKKIELDYIQLHGDESSNFCRNLEFPVIKAFRIQDNFDINIINDYFVHAYLFDTFQENLFGGTGSKFNWNLISNLKTSLPIVLSGGLYYGNVKEGIEVVSPSAIDVNSGIELKPGIKDKNKMIKLFNIIKLKNVPLNPFLITNSNIES